MSSSKRSDTATPQAVSSSSGERPPRRSWWPAARTLLALAVLVSLVTWAVVRQQPEQIDKLDGLAQDAVVASDTGAPQVGGPWLVTSGSLLTRHGELWSGVPDADPPDPARGHTGSSVLRAVSTRRDYQDVHVSVEMALSSLVESHDVPAQDWDGVHIFLRYQGAGDLYVVDLSRRDGTLAIKRKRTAGAGSSPSSGTGAADASSDGADSASEGEYTTLATTSHPVGHQWHRYQLNITNVPKGVAILLSIDGRTVLTAVDRDGSALRGPGRVGVRGDNADFTIRTFIIEPLS